MSSLWKPVVSVTLDLPSGEWSDFYAKFGGAASVVAVEEVVGPVLPVCFSLKPLLPHFLLFSPLIKDRISVKW